MSGSGVYYTAGQLASMGTAITQAQTALQQAQASPTSANISAVTAALNNYYGVQINNPTNGAVMRGYAELAQSVVTNTGVGIVANQEVQNAVGQATYTSLYQANLALQLAVADQSVITNNGGQVPTLADVAEYHASVFTDFNIPVAAWGGAAYTALGEDYTLGAATSAELSSIQPANSVFSAMTEGQVNSAIGNLLFAGVTNISAPSYAQDMNGITSIAVMMSKEGILYGAQSVPATLTTQAGTLNVTYTALGDVAASYLDIPAGSSQATSEADARSL